MRGASASHGREHQDPLRVPGRTVLKLCSFRLAENCQPFRLIEWLWVGRLRGSEDKGSGEIGVVNDRLAIVKII